MAFNPFEQYDTLVKLYEDWQNLVLPYNSQISKDKYSNLLDCALSICADIGVDAFLASEASRLLSQGITDKRLKEALLALPTNFPDLERLNGKTGDFTNLQAWSRREYEYRLANGEFHFALNPKTHDPIFIHPMLQGISRIKNHG